MKQVKPEDVSECALWPVLEYAGSPCFIFRKLSPYCHTRVAIFYVCCAISTVSCHYCVLVTHVLYVFVVAVVKAHSGIECGVLSFLYSFD